ncbi:CAP domain-containing protein [Demequina gelatinilytica]|uniref:CAP domain-containing protein n=1 Tax=Demequina gelatinilytica TaxID=1638980 RepID=UPI0007850B65|nr:CAP domain-containing protein [Demequina gelatinilytica]
MTEMQDVLERNRRRRRHAPAILLGGLPVVIASTVLASAYTFAPATASYAQDAIDAPAVEDTQPQALPTITASAEGVEAPRTHTVKVTKPKPTPTPTPAPTAASTSASSGGTVSAPSTSGSTTRSTSGSSGSTTPASTTVDFTAYCANPQAPSGASSVSGLLAAANAERAKAGIAPLTWSGSLASAAQSWSRSMAAADSKTDAPADALAHNPSRPGAENVGVAYRSTGMSESTAMNKLHVNWVYSSGHCANLMNPAYSQMGAGAAVTDDGTTWYATQNFR